MRSFGTSASEELNHPFCEIRVIIAWGVRKTVQIRCGPAAVTGDESRKATVGSDGKGGE